MISTRLDKEVVGTIFDLKFFFKMLNVGKDFLGQKTLLWQLCGVFCGCLMSGVEVFLALFLQVLLGKLGMSTPNTLPSFTQFMQNFSGKELGAFLLLLGMLRGGAQFFILQSAVMAHEAINSRLRVMCLHDMLMKSFNHSPSASAISSQMSEIFPKTAQFCYFVSLLIPNLIQCLFIMCFMLNAAFHEALIGIIGIGITGVLILNLNRHVRRVANLTQKEQEEMLGGIERVANNWLLVKALRTGLREYVGLVNNVLGYSSAIIRANLLANIGAVLPSVLGVIILVAIVFAGNSHATAGISIVSFLFLFLRFIQIIGTVASNFGAANGFYPQFRTSLSIFASATVASKLESAKISSKLSILNSTDPLLEFKSQSPNSNQSHFRSEPPSVRLEDVSFSYQNKSSEVIRSISLTVEGGHQLGIVGKSGTGKSTILGLILGVIEPKEGKISIDSLAPEDFFRDNGRVSYVGADPFLLSDTIKANLEYGSWRDRPDEDYEKALTQAVLLDVVSSLPGGLLFRLGPNGDGLSMGQKQRLALARAFLVKPDLLILDEASANLDSHTESLISETLNSMKGSCTTIIVSHREGLLRYCDSICNLDSD